MRLLKVKPSKIKIPELRVTAKFDEETREILRKSIKQVGTLAPVIVQEIDGELVLVDGLHRIEDSIAAGDEAISVAVLDGDMVDLLCRNLFLDHARGKTPVSQMVKVIGALFTDHNLNSEDIRERTGLTRDYIEKLIKISEASPTVQQALDEGIIGVGHAYELARLPFPAQQDEVVAKHQVWRFTVPELKGQVDAVLKEMDLMKEAPPVPEATEPRPAPVYKCEGCKTEIEPRYLRPAMVCPGCFGQLFRSAQAVKVEDAKDNKESEGA